MIPRIRGVQIRNYKSIAQLTINLEPFTALVGRNGTGKSNFIEALEFVKNCLFYSIEFAFIEKGGISAVRRRSAGHPTDIEISLILDLPNETSAYYSFKISAKFGKEFTVSHEHCKVKRLFEEHEFETKIGEFIKKLTGIRPKVSSDRLMLYGASTLDEYRPVFDFLTSMRFYSIIPDALRMVKKSEKLDFYLSHDGSNAASILKHLQRDENISWRYDRLCNLLSKVTQGLKKVESHSVGQIEKIQFKQDVGTKHPWIFEALNMSDGTLRILGLLMAVYQPGIHTVLAIEEPEATVHPGITEMIIEVLMDASNDRQVLITTHSPDILDYRYLQDSQIKLVTLKNFSTIITPLSPSNREAIRKHLYTAGELLRLDELTPDIDEAKRATKQMKFSF
jgi:predicted ATPase